MKKFIFILALALCANAQEDFKGWKEMRVIKSERGDIYIDDFLQQGQDTLMLINHQQARLDFYNFVPEGQRQQSKSDDSPNALPMANEFKLTELAITRPIEAVKNITIEGKSGLLVQTLYPDQLTFYKKIKDGWEEEQTWKLIADEFHGLPIIVDNNTAYLSAKKGIQTITLNSEGRVSHLEPRDNDVNRVWWWHLDVDGDKQKDIVEWVSGKLKYLKKSKHGEFLPAVELHDENFSHAEISTGKKGADFYLISNQQENLLGHYLLKEDKEIKEFGKQTSLPTGKASLKLNTSMILNEKKSLIQADTANSLFKIYSIENDSWSAINTFPGMRDIQSIAAPLAQSGTILIHVKNAPQLFFSEWKNDRLSYPRPWPQKQETEKDETILNLARTEGITWWVTKKAKNLELRTWNADQDKIEVSIFKGIGDKVEDVNWLGGKQIIYRQKYRQELMFAQVKQGKTISQELSKFKKANINEFSFIIKEDKQNQALRLVGGIVTWLNDKLDPIDQINLPNSSKIRSYVQINDNEALALDQTGRNIHSLKKDKSGIYRSYKENEVIGSNTIFKDPIFGLSSLNSRALTLLHKGSSKKLTLQSSIDKRLIDIEGVKKTHFSDYRLMDVTGNNKKDLLIMDYPNRRLSLLELKNNKEATKTLSWTVFDDKKYSYGGGRSSRDDNSQPQEVISADFDQDGKQDLVMMCQDRIIFYLAEKELSK
ncbi:hypothetical protein PQO03_06955 [Lentisphaera profundi]|uniref:VCBS repeat-containing protein n=1 Tax=Lentisphaera profundi TaxID=1658616 RepID=A0ABY7VQD6_9BACT|nr:hypothetical protein [Lentisphaera profundi]WDE95455.1 hypothetical protein PQO03_06955 [Lentisphaera profundi]